MQEWREGWRWARAGGLQRPPTMDNAALASKAGGLQGCARTLHPAQHERAPLS